MSVPVIRVEPGRLADVVEKATEALLSGPLDDVWYSSLPRVLSYREVGGEYVWLTFDEDYVASLLSECTSFEDDHGRRIDPPKQVVRMVFGLLEALGQQRHRRLRQEMARIEQQEAR